MQSDVGREVCEECDLLLLLQEARDDDCLHHAKAKDETKKCEVQKLGAGSYLVSNATAVVIKGLDEEYNAEPERQGEP